MSEPKDTNEAACGGSALTAELDATDYPKPKWYAARELEMEVAALEHENTMLREGWERECRDIDSIFEAVGWTEGLVRTEGGSLRVESLKNALRDMLAPGDGG